MERHDSPSSPFASQCRGFESSPAQAGDIEGAWRELARAIQVGKLARRPIEADPDLAPLRARLDWETRLNDLIPRRTLETPDSGEDRNDEL